MKELVDCHNLEKITHPELGKAGENFVEFIFREVRNITNKQGLHLKTHYDEKTIK